MKVNPFQIRNVLFCGVSALAFVALPSAASAQEAAVPAADPALAADAAAAAAQTDAAQTDEQPDENVVVVTGFRSSIASALNIKRRESGVVDAIVAEDIAEFPDLNLAESLQRIPGVAITRVQGEGRQVSVRGLGSEYTRVRINGMEAITTSSGTANSGGTNRSRGFDFNIFASDLFSNLIVRKTASADVEEGSLGATVDLRTARPFDFREGRFVVSAQASYNDLARDVTPRLSALLSERFADGRIGVLVSAAYEQRHLLEEGANITRWQPGSDNGGFHPSSTVPGLTIAQINSTAIFHPRIPSYVSYDVNSERLGLTGSVQFEPVDDTVITIDGLYSLLQGTRGEAQIQAIGLSRGGTGKPRTIIRDGVVENGDLVYALMDDVDVRSQTSYDELNTEFMQFTGSIEHRINERIQLRGLVGYADSQFEAPVSTTVTFDRVDTDGFSYDFRGDRMPTINFGFDTANPANWSHINGTSEVRIRPSTVRNQFTTGQLNAEFEASDALTFKAGVDWRRFQYDGTDERRNAGELVTQTLTPAQVAQYSQLFGGFTGNTGLGTGATRTWVQPNLDLFARDFNIYCDCGIYELGGVENSAARGGNDSVREVTTGIYAQADFRFSLGGIDLRGDVGGRWFRSSQRSSGYAAVGNSVQLVTAEREYDMFLPAANLAADLTSTLVARISAAQTIARPSLGTLTPGGNVSVQGANRNFTTGNPDLRPTRSTNLDLSLEWYPESGSVLAVGFFYKDINTFVQTLRREAVYSSLGLPPELLIGTGATVDEVFQVTQPVNSEGGILSGFEINLQKSLDFLPGFLSHLGVLANYTYVNSDIEYLTSTVPGAPTVRATLVGLSQHAANGTLFYEDSRFSLRGSVAYRSGYLTQVPGSNGNSVHGTNGTVNVDMQMSYNITDRLRFSIEALNLTDQYNDLYVGDTNRLNVYTHTGRQFIVGLRYSM